MYARNRATLLLRLCPRFVSSSSSSFSSFTIFSRFFSLPRARRSYSDICWYYLTLVRELYPLGENGRLRQDFCDRWNCVFLFRANYGETWLWLDRFGQQWNFDRPLIAVRTCERKGDGHNQPRENCKEEVITDSDRHQVYTHSVQREGNEGNRRTDITKMEGLIKSDRHLYPF